MPTPPGLTLRVAAHFSAERFVTTPLWLLHENRPATPAEAAVAGWDAGEPAAHEAGLALLELPRHLLRRWHALLGDGASNVEAASFARLARATVDFLRFKRCALPTASACSLEVRRREASPSSASNARFAFHLGTGPMPFVFAGVAQSFAEAEATSDEWWGKFRLRWPGHPVMRLDLLPGQGVALPERPWVHERCGREDGQPAVWLLITRAENS